MMRNVLAAVPWAAGLMVELVARLVRTKEWPRFEGAAWGMSNDGSYYWMTMLSGRFHNSATLVETSTNVVA
jgi:hypothetical protein